MAHGAFGAPSNGRRGTHRNTEMADHRDRATAHWAAARAARARDVHGLLVGFARRPALFFDGPAALEPPSRPAVGEHLALDSAHHARPDPPSGRRQRA